MPTPERSSHRDPGGERDYLSLLGGFVAALLVLLAVLYGAATWKEVRADQANQLDTALILSQKALDRFFVESQAQLRELSLDLEEDGGLDNLVVARGLLKRYAALHADAVAITLMRPDGQVIATSTLDGAPPEGFPSMATYPSFQAFLYELGAGRDMSLGRPLVSADDRRWVFPMRYPVRDAAGQLAAVISVSVPVDFIEQFWRSAPVTAHASIGLVRDDGYLISRYPVPGQLGPEEVYGKPQLDALRIHLLAHQFPAKGYVEGDGRLGGVVSVSAHMRLDHFPVTLFVTMPKSEFHADWWGRVQAPFGIALVFAALGAIVFRVMSSRQRAWARERRIGAGKLRSLVEHMVAGVMVHGPDGCVESANSEARAILCLDQFQPPDRPLHVGDWTLVDEDGAEIALADYPLVQVMRSRQPMHKVAIGVKGVHRDVLWLLCSLSPELDFRGELVRTVVTFVDISADRNAERAMRRSERRFRLLYETNLDAVLQTAMGGDVLAANPAACAMFGCDEATIKRLGRTGLVSATDPRFDELIARRGVDGHATGVVAMQRADGTPFEAEASSVMMVGDDEIYCSWVLHDVTERRVAEAAVAARIAAEDANRAKTEFIAHMSHELRTPLNAILGFSAVLQMDTRRTLHPAHLLQVGHIRNAGSHLLAMISDLLDLSSMESGSVRLNVEAIDPWQLAMQAIRDLAGRAEAAQVQVSLHPPLPTLGRMHGDATRFSQIVLNLLSNAIKYNRPGGHALVSLAVDDGRLTLTMRDGGRGMTAAQQDALFQPFNRLGREGSNIEGTGIGLVITKRLVELMDGALRVRSTIGDGSEFEVELPFERAESATRARLPAPCEAAAASDGVCTVIYIDDDPINRLLVKALLEMRDDVCLRLASSGAEGVAAALERRPDLVLTDMRMAGMNGLEVMRDLRARDEFRHARIVAVSASAMAAEIDLALAAGFDNYLTKPVMADQLFREVDVTLARTGGQVAEATSRTS